MSTAEQPVATPPVVPGNKSRPDIAWQCVAGFLAILGYVTLDGWAVGQMYKLRPDQWLGREVIAFVATRPLVTVITGAWLHPLSILQIVVLAFGIGFGLAGLRRSRAARKLLAAAALVYLCWIALFWYYRLITALLRPA